MLTHIVNKIINTNNINNYIILLRNFFGKLLKLIYLNIIQKIVNLLFFYYRENFPYFLKIFYNSILICINNSYKGKLLDY